MHSRVLVLIASFLGATGVGLGAYHAHGLARWLERHTPEFVTTSSGQIPRAESIERRMGNAETAVRYQLVHAVALLALAALQRATPCRILSASAILMTAGVAGFSGGLYQIVFTGRPWHWAIVPLGGLVLIIAWIFLAASALASGTKSG